MPYPHGPADETSMSNFDELRWVIQIRQTLEEELAEDEDIPVCIFNVPKTLKATKPEVYTPQQISIGPYHYWRPELYDMERYKLVAAKRAQKRFKNNKFHNLVGELTKLDSRIRGCYHKYLDFNDETLAWMMSVDTSFVLEHLQLFVVKEGKDLTRITSGMSHLVDYSGRKSAHHAILRDIVMLENQIPLVAFRKFLEFEHSSLQVADGLLSSMLIDLCLELSPFNMVDFPSIEISEIAHFLDFFYKVIVGGSEAPSEVILIEEDAQINPQENIDFQERSGYVKQLFYELWRQFSKLSRPLKLLGRLPWDFFANLPYFSLLKRPFQHLTANDGKEDSKTEDETLMDKPPLVEEISIPSVSELYNSGVRFVPSHGDIKNISFDVKTVTFHLPAVNLDVNTEVLLRNLVAYEASTGPGQLFFSRYTELMNGIIDTTEDVKILRKSGVVLNYLKSDWEVANLWNGMNKSIRLTKVPALDKVIEEVNKYYSSRWKIKAKKLIKRYVYESWKILTFLAAILLLVLLTMQSVCSVYRCAGILHIA